MYVIILQSVHKVDPRTVFLIFYQSLQTFLINVIETRFNVLIKFLS